MKIKNLIMKRYCILSLLLGIVGVVNAQETTSDTILTSVPEQEKVVYYYEQPPVDVAPFFKDNKRPILYVNETITTHIVMPEHIKLVDLSTDKIVGNQCADNIVRIKPNGVMRDQEYLGTITLIGERNIALYDLVYTGQTQYAATLFYIPQRELAPYINPSVQMPQKEMAEYAWAIYTSGKKFYNLSTKAQGMTMAVNNIYSIGDYFFIDFSLENHTNIKYDIEELRIKLLDKKETKATNSQTIELEPEFILNDTKSFRKSYRNVIVLKKLTFPEEKILQLELYENQISGRTITLPIAYEDILHADAVSKAVIKRLPNK